MGKRLIFVKPDGTPCTTRSGEQANSGAPPVLVVFGDYDARRLRQFASEHGGALVEGWEAVRGGLAVQRGGGMSCNGAGWMPATRGVASS
jgi:hypothetical protein